MIHVSSSSAQFEQGLPCARTSHLTFRRRHSKQALEARGRRFLKVLVVVFSVSLALGDGVILRIGYIFLVTD